MLTQNQYRAVIGSQAAKGSGTSAAIARNGIPVRPEALARARMAQAMARGGKVKHHRLDAEQRRRLPKGDFALPGKGAGPKGKGAGSYPIPDETHARDALARVAQFGSPTEQAEVRRKVHAKFPTIGAQHKSKKRRDWEGGHNRVGG